MKTQAAILIETGRPLELAEIEIPHLRAGQVLVEVAYSGVCHTQLLEAHGYRGEDKYLPHCLGHEGSGRVVERGPGVSKAAVGDRVILTWMQGNGANVPGTVYGWEGRKVNAGAVTTFQHYAVVSENRLVPLPEQVSDSDGALLGCAVPTGFGAVWNAAQLGTAQSVAVFGIGGIGCSAVSAASARQASPLIAVDVNSDRLRLASTFGATELIDATKSDCVERIQTLCPSGIDVAIEATGNTMVMRQALEVVRVRGGSVVVIGNAKHGEQLQIDPRQLNQGKRLIGTWGGDNIPDRDFPQYCDLLISGTLDLKPLYPKVYSLEQINQALDDLEQGIVPRPLIKLDDATAAPS
jgi:S-(hydroxymethyl)glutathione dehydrogenase/alcohol dehydrogenase